MSDKRIFVTADGREYLVRIDPDAYLQGPRERFNLMTFATPDDAWRAAVPVFPSVELGALSSQELRRLLRHAIRREESARTA